MKNLLMFYAFQKKRGTITFLTYPIGVNKESLSNVEDRRSVLTAYRTDLIQSTGAIASAWATIVATIVPTAATGVLSYMTILLLLRLWFTGHGIQTHRCSILQIN